MKKKVLALALASVLAVGALAGCDSSGQEVVESLASSDTESTENTETSTEENSDKVASADDMTTIEDVTEEGMAPIYGSDIKDGVYSVAVSSSSSMFNIVDCELTVEDGTMTAVMTMSGTGYLYVYLGTGEEAVNADESEYIPYEEDSEGAHTFTVPVEALDAGIACTAFSKSKEMWYDRTILFRADSLPMDAFEDGVITTWEGLGLEDGTYTVSISLSGGSGKASVDSPATIHAENGVCTATVTWSSSNYDYMLVNDEKYLPVNTEGNSVFEIPVSGFDYNMPVIADTVAMSEPHEISYTLKFDSSSLQKED